MKTPVFDHVLRLSDATGIFEHADHTVPRRGHGYCVDDVARLLIVIAREPEPDKQLTELARTSVRFLSEAQAADGTMRNRCSAAGRWTGLSGVQDCWGRSLWAFGTAAKRSTDTASRELCSANFDRGADRRSPHMRSMVFAALGAAEVLAMQPRHFKARRLLVDAAVAIGRPAADPNWPWPAARLSYANAALPEALLAAGEALGRSDLVDDGLALLRWLLERETHDGHLSPTPVGGSGPGDSPPVFDQQPIEVAAMADACRRAFAITGDADWIAGIQLAVGWFAGENDSGSPMFDADSGGGYDGLHASGPNLNQGAESTLALLSTLQHAQWLTTMTSLAGAAAG